MAMRKAETAKVPPGLDPGIQVAVEVLMAAGIETFESCEGGAGHSYPEPTVRFHGQQPEGWKALTAALYDGRLRVSRISRLWSIQDGEPVGPYWEMTFKPTEFVRSTKQGWIWPGIAIQK